MASMHSLKYDISFGLKVYMLWMSVSIIGTFESKNTRPNRGGSRIIDGVNNNDQNNKLSPNNPFPGLKPGNQGNQPISFNQTNSSSENLLDDDELKLVNLLFNINAYNKDVRPVMKKEEIVQVVFDLAYTQLLDLDEKNQVLVSNVWVRMKWYNELLKWNSEDFGGIETINIDSSKIWIPDIVLQNNAEESLGAGQMDLFQTKVILKHNGENQFYAPTILRSRCEINVEYFPFDDQKCKLSFLSLSYDRMRLNITNKTSQADRIFYLESAEFNLLSANAESQEFYHGDCAAPFMNVVYTIHIRRKTLFYFNNLIGPCFLITILCLFTFLLPPETGERVTLVITTLLAMTVFMLTIAEKTPPTSKVTPLIGKFFISSMVIIGLSLIATCVVLNLHECRHSPKTVPRLVRIIFLDYLAPFLHVSFNKDLLSSKNLLSSKKILQNGKLPNIVKAKANGHATKVQLSHRAQTWNPVTPHQRSSLSIPKEVLEGIGVLADRANQRNEEERAGEEWETIAKIFDRLFFIIFFITIAISATFIYSNRTRLE